MTINWTKTINSYTDDNGNGITRENWIGHYHSSEVVIEIVAGADQPCTPQQMLEDPDDYIEVTVRAYRQSDPHFMYLSEGSETRLISSEDIESLANALDSYSGDYTQAFQVI